MLLALFAVGTLGFYVLLTVHFVIMLALIDREKVGWATISLGVVLASLYFLGDFNIVSAVINSPLTAVAVLGGYFVAGTAWSVAKWWFFVRNIRDDYNQLKAQFLKRNNVEGTSIPDALKTKWKEELVNDTHYGRDRRRSFANGVIPKPGDHKARIFCWMCYWPWSATWTLLNDPVKRLWQQIYLQIQGLLQGISNHAFRGVADDLAEPPASPPPASGEPNGDAQPRGVRRGGAAGVDGAVG